MASDLKGGNEQLKSVYLLKFNLYGNRTLKRSDSLVDYLGTNSENVIDRISDCTLWTPNDGITTTIKTNLLQDDFLIEPDYCVTVDGFGNIVSRWFVTENTRIRKGQYFCKLRRDVIAEAWNVLQEATCWIDRALLKATDSRLFNAENVSVSQIKTSETLLKDRTGCPWIVCYGAPDIASAPTGQVQSEYQYDVITGQSPEEYIASNTYKYLPENQDSVNVSLLWYDSRAVNQDRYALNFLQNDTEAYMPGATVDRYLRSRSLYPVTITDPDAVPKADIFNAVKSLQPQYKSSEEAQRQYDNRNKILYSTATSKYYKISVFQDGGFANDNYNVNEYSTLYSLIRNQVLNNVSELEDPSDFTYENATYSINWRTITTDLVELEDYGVTYKFPIDKYQPTDAPYFAWCLPYGNIKTKMSSLSPIITTSAEMNLNIATSLARTSSVNSIYSIEILPYCPLPEKYFDTDIDGSFVLNAQNDTDLTDTSTVADASGVKGFIYSMPRTSFKADISCNVSVTNKKVQSLLNLWRITSPSNGSSFEFSVEKNNGLRGFTASCTYIPITPYIAVRPIWGGINGGNFPDSRCLILKDDFSITRLSDAWINYQEQNKNFESIFQRGIENMDVNRRYQRVSEYAQGLTGAIGAGVMGTGLTGSTVGGVALAGLSAAGGAADAFMSELMFRENRSYQTDIHNLQLQNIQAMPTTISKTTGINIDNRYFPVLEKFTATTSERYAVNKYLVNNSFACGFIDRLGLYVNNTWVDEFGNKARNFISGHIININLQEDPHFMETLNQELTQGVYLDGNPVSN